MNVFTAFLLTLVQDNYEDTKQQQMRFYADPEALMRAFSHDGKQLSLRHMSIICSLSPNEILEEAKKDSDLPAKFPANLQEFVRRINNDYDWPKQGDTERDPWRDPSHPCEDPGASPAGEQRIFWSAPHAQILHVFTRTAQIGEQFELKITGEGFLPKARVMLVSRDHDVPFVIAENASKYQACNIRRTYIAVQMQIPDTAPTGEYFLFVTNPGWRHRLEWGSAFRVLP